MAGPSLHICDACIELCTNILVQDRDSAEPRKSKTARAAITESRLCGICMEERESDELIFLPHAAYMCAACLEDIQAVRDKQVEK